MNILLCSVGRRPYLVRWFKDALRENGLSGAVVAADLDPASPARPFADIFVTAPRVESANYDAWLSEILNKHKITLAVSVNDFELSTWSALPQTEEWKSLIRLTSEVQNCIEDKYSMSGKLREEGINSPVTWLGGEGGFEDENNSRLITKGRFGSASRGLQFTSREKVLDSIQTACLEVTTRQGIPATGQSEIVPENLVIVQPEVQGTEFGLDIICNLDSEFEAVLARKKISMRGGETDRAESVDPSPFFDIARQLATVVPHQGTMDVDVIVDANGEIYVIDINPRFGGGYPFSHLAGARIPNAYVSWAVSREPHPEWLQSEPGVISGKYVETVRVS